MKIATTEQMREIEKKADAQGLSYATMMENAGTAVACEIAKHLGAEGKRVLVLVGPGNNGGDGLVAARHLHDDGAEVQLYIWKHKRVGDENFRLTQERNIACLRSDDDANLAELRRSIADADIVVDALLGTGVSRPIGGRLKDILNLLRNDIDRREGTAPSVVAVDVPSGLDCDTGAMDPATVPADLTITLALPKRGFYSFPAADYLGQLVVSDIGLPPALTVHLPVELIDRELVRGLLPLRPRSAHKGTFGKALIVAGSPNYTGAAYLASAAATRVGTGLVTLCLAESLHPILASKLVEVTFLILPHDLGALVPEAIKLLEERYPEYDALLVGPGLGSEDATVQFVHRLLDVEVEDARRQIGFLHTKRGNHADGRKTKELPALVIDADGLNALARAPGWWESLRGQAVLTPHPGEMSRLRSCSIQEVEADRVASAQEAAQEWGQTVVLKGPHTVIAAPGGRIAISPFANPGLATAGTGDVLAGSIVGFLAQGLSAYDAARAGVYIHGAAGEMATAALGNAGTVAGDLLPLLPRALNTIQRGC
jgi:NAD(P)H-hydrate epimerase